MEVGLRLCPVLPTERLRHPAMRHSEAFPLAKSLSAGIKLVLLCSVNRQTV
jgi:hypothetical protein